ncbi:MAG: formylglycine-generating enzyme family protein [Nitrospira sp.]|nr:MAG: formylglycine-generating enzyme family protein [Nitrospira sp.]
MLARGGGLILGITLMGPVGPAQAGVDVITGPACLEKVVRIQLSQVVPPLVGNPVVHEGVTHLAYVDNLTYQTVQAEVPIRYWGEYHVWGSRALEIEQGERASVERIDTVTVGYVTVPPHAKRQLMGIKIGRPQDVFQYPPEPVDTIRMPEYELAPEGAKCVLAGKAIRQSPVPSRTAPLPVQEARARPYEGPSSGSPGAGGKDDGVPMVLVKGGEFTMGSMSGSRDELPPHRVQLDAFYLDTYEVTNKRFRQFVEDTKYQTTAQAEGSGKLLGSDLKWVAVAGAHWLKPEGGESVFASNREEHPVVQVSWGDAEAYCAWAGKRLPTEVEWEYAARAGATTAHWWGDGPPGSRRVENVADVTHKQAFPARSLPIMEGYTDEFARTAPVGMFEANPWGLHDMAGNVSEWVSDWYGERHMDSPLRNPTGKARGEFKVIRGGSWFNTPRTLRSAYRNDALPSYRNYVIGFRCAKTP